MDNFSEDGDPSVLNMVGDENTYVSCSDDVNAALDKIEKLLSEDEQLLKKMEVRQQLETPESAKNISQSLAIQSNGIINRVSKIERIFHDHNMQPSAVPITRVDDNLLVQKTIRQLDQIRAKMIDRSLLPNPPQFQQTIGRNKRDNNAGHDYSRHHGAKRAIRYQSRAQLLERKQHEISLLSDQNKAALGLKKQWQKTTEDARLELQRLQHWIEQLVPLSAELLNPSADASLNSAHGQVLHLLEQPNYANESMGRYIDKKMNDITSMLAE